MISLSDSKLVIVPVLSIVLASGVTPRTTLLLWDVVLVVHNARHTSHDNRQARRLVSVDNSPANHASENDDDDGDDEATYVLIHAFTLMSRRFTLMPRVLKMRCYMLRCKRPATRQHRRCTKFLTSASSRASSSRST